MAKVEPRATVSFTAVLTLTEIELRAMDALVGYGDDAFLEHFKATLGKTYIRDHEAGLKSVFAAIRRDVLPALSTIDQVRRDLAEIVEKRRAASNG